MNLPALASAALLLVAAAGVTAGWLGGRAAAVPALVMAAAAALTQLAAARLTRRAMDAPFTQFLGAWALGIGLRFSGVVLLAALTLAAPLYFPPLPSAFAFLAVLIPLLLLEIRLTR